MKKKTLLTLTLFIGSFNIALSQFTSDTRIIGALLATARIDTSPTLVTLTLTGPSNRWMGIGFGGLTMATATDMFIWNDTPNRDYTTHPSGNSGHNLPTPDADQSWTVNSDVVNSGTRTVVATRSLVSAGDYTFINDFSLIQIIFAQGATTSLAYHDTNPHGGFGFSRVVLALEKFSEDAPSLYPNPSKGDFTIKTKTNLDKIIIYGQTGAVVKTINIEHPKDENEVNINGLAAGVYVVELQNGTQKTYKNLLVE